ncbi:hypothetical protein SAMN05720606_102269 [Paenibacillus polysaccharolyticus]|uniref:Uncharacterized protein n=1 Tax=Paenibacillus polysaccharolyticus TaxID=582692 RepID=A0A1G5CZI6_9BACL|nr:hypothetical protein [Paenibacillus polysaccharolyticus]SCY07802.1 hypothetical protein SAMN05720606_102269 [Paenibacillus polysaccharolyticus]
MVRTLDARTSLGSDGNTPLNIHLITELPTLVGILGLNIVNPGPVIRTQFNGTYRISVDNIFSLPSSIQVNIFRGPTNAGAPIYTFSQPIYPEQGSVLVSFEGSDYNVPPPSTGQLTYSCYLTFFQSSPSQEATRLGPECFNAVAYSDD